MKKIILIEDRPRRQSQFLNEIQIEQLLKTEGLEMPQEADCRTRIEKINSEEMDDFSNFDLIIVHRSSLNEKGLNALNSVCKERKTSLVLFSGGLSQSTYHNDGFENLSLNSKDFYSNHLLIFIENYIKEETSSLLELIYGSKWQLAPLLQYRLLKTKYDLEENEEVKIILEDELNGLEGSMNIDKNTLDKEIDKLIATI